MELPKIFGSHPDGVGSAEYRAMYELLDDTLKDCPEDEQDSLLQSMCEEFMYLASAMIKDVEEYRRKKSLTAAMAESTVPCQPDSKEQS